MRDINEIRKLFNNMSKDEFIKFLKKYDFIIIEESEILYNIHKNLFDKCYYVDNY